MKKSIIFGVVFLLLFFFISPFTVFSYEMSERWVCLKSTHCWENKPESEACVIKNGHTAKLEADPTIKLLPNKTTYLVECLATEDGQICTTGTSENDMTVYRRDDLLDYLKNKAEYEFQGLLAKDGTSLALNPLTSKADGTIDPVYWKSYSSGHARKFLALNYWVPAGEGFSGQVGALQQGTVDFDFVTAEKDCLSIAWDPYGRVFDSSSLEPIKGARVTLLIKRDNDSFSQMTTSDLMGGNLINPQTLKEDGMFSFVVPDGTYKLEITNPNYTFPVAELNQLNPNYSKIYSDIYPAATGEEIIQEGEIQHRDIPVTSNTTPTNTLPKLMEYFYDAKPISKSVMVEGIVSHPFTKIIAYSLKTATGSAISFRYRQVGQTQADKMGKFKLNIDQTTFEPDEIYGEVDLSKVDLSLLTKKNNSLFEKIISFLKRTITEVKAQTSSITTHKFDPIPTYLEGYAYDNTGKIMPEVTVGVYLTFSNKPYYQTKADEKGYFKITSENLPTMAYEIRYTSPLGAVVKMTTTQFVAQNKQYLASNKINLNVYKNEKGKILTNQDVIAKKPAGFSQKGDDGGEGAKTGENKTHTTAKNSMLTIIGILIFLIIAVVVILGAYLIKKRQTERSIPPAL